jgi:molybdate transport system substrate-binding protein
MSTSVATAPVTAARLKVLSAGALKYVIVGMAPQFTRDTGTPVDTVFGTIAVVRQRLKNGETADIIGGTATAIEELERSGVLLPGSLVAVGSTMTGLGVREDTPAPDISTPERFRKAMLDARSIAYTDPQAGGTSGIYLTGLLERLGIADAVARKAVLCVNGDVVVDKVLAGEAEIASTFLSEIMPRKGMKVVGPLPPPIRHTTSYAVGISATSGNRDAAHSFIATLTDPAQRDFRISRGFEPAIF